MLNRVYVAVRSSLMCVFTAMMKEPQKSMKTQSVQPEDIANIVLWLHQQPEHVNINRIEVMPTAQSFAGMSVSKEK